MIFLPAEQLHILLLGPPGAGKSTQMALLTRSWPIIAISTGKMLREEVTAGTALGCQVQELLARGELVDDALMISIIHKWLEALPPDKGFLLDGFPRTIAQAQALDLILDELDRPLTAVINLELTDDEAVYRLGGRRICYGAGPEEIIHISDEVAVARCLARGGKLVQRQDDMPSVILRRLAVHRADTQPLIEFYESRGIAQTISANGPPEEVADDIIAVVEEALQEQSLLP